MARTLVTGAGGLAGSALVQHLESLGEEVVALSSREQCDLVSFSDTLALFRFLRPDRVFHLAAAVFGVGGNMAFPGEVSYRNSMINLNVIEASRVVGVSKIVAMGSAAVYSDGLNQPMREQDALTGEPHSSEFAYAHSKRAMYVNLQAYAQQYGMEFAFVISTNLYGPGDRFDTNYGHVVPSLLKKFLDAEVSGQKVEVWGDGSPTRDFLYIADAARALVLIMQSGKGAFNMATGASVPIAELVTVIASQFPGAEYYWNKDRPLGQLKRAYDTSRLQALGFSPQFSLPDGIAQTVQWMKTNGRELRI